MNEYQQFSMEETGKIDMEILMMLYYMTLVRDQQDAFALTQFIDWT